MILAVAFCVCCFSLGDNVMTVAKDEIRLEIQLNVEYVIAYSSFIVRQMKRILVVEYRIQTILL